MTHDLIANDAVMPTPAGPIQQGERRLYREILHEALRDLNKKEHYNDAYRWLTDTKSYYPTSLKRCCEILGISATSVAWKVRTGLRVENGSLGMNGTLTKVSADPQVREKNWLRRVS